MTLEDAARAPRMKDTMKAEDLDTGACVLLAETILQEAARELTDTTIEFLRNPDALSRDRLEGAKRFYLSDWFGVLSCGVVDGEDAMNQIMTEARKKYMRRQARRAVE